MKLQAPILFALLASVAACSGANGVDLSTRAPMDATAPVEASVSGPDATSVEPDVSAGGDDGSVAPDSSEGVDSGASADAGGSGEAGADEEGGASLCSRICGGCCDALGKCRTGNTQGVCGVQGASCEDCSMQKCPLTESGCCGSKGCGCAVAGLIGCN